MKEEEVITLAENSSDKNLMNKYALLAIESKEVKEIYSNIFGKTEGSLAVVADNDAITKIDMATATLNPTDQQLLCLEDLRETFKKIESVIDPARLTFSIDKASDDEVCLTHYASSGISKIIIHDDGLIAYSFISTKGSDKADVLDFYHESVDYESLAYKLFGV